jgi:hypothetical protein
MFRKKVKIRFIDTNWVIIKDNFFMKTTPRKDELVYINDTYYEIVNILHDISGKDESTFAFIKKLEPKVKIKLPDNHLNR